MNYWRTIKPVVTSLGPYDHERLERNSRTSISCPVYNALTKSTQARRLTTKLGQQVTVSKLIAINMVWKNSRSRFLICFVVRFVTKRYILQQKCLKGQIR